jgi:endo-1,4-beta-xylanase
MNNAMRAIYIFSILLSSFVGFGVNAQTLKDALKDDFLIGAALNDQHVRKNDTVARLAVAQFNSIVAENCMKSEYIHPSAERWNFKAADRFVKFGVDNNMAVIGHTLIWHSQLAPWFCVDENGKPVSAKVLKKRMREYIHTLVGRYKGQIHGWDVVNEAIEDDGTWRKSPFYEILGQDYIKLAFKYAHEADPDAELYYNDYNLSTPVKREKAIELVKWLKKQGCRIDAVGMQGHIGMDYPSFEEAEKSIVDIAATGVKIMITEFDLSAIPTVHMEANVSDLVPYDAAYDPYKTGLSEEASQAWNSRVADCFRIWLKHYDVISRVTVWGVNDEDSWKNDFPMNGRTDYPLLFNRDCTPKPVVNQLINGELR